MPIIGKITPPAGFPLEANRIIATAVNLVLAVAGVVFFFMLIIGGFRYLTAGGDEKVAQEARKTLTNAMIGLIIIVASFLVAQLLFRIFGLNSLIRIV